MKTVTPKQQRVLDFIIDFRAREQYPPTMAEIQKGLGYRSINSVADNLAALEKKRKIECKKGSPRAIKIL